MHEITKETILTEISIYDAGIEKIEKEFNFLMPMEVKMLINRHEGEFVFIADGEHYRILTRDEILDTKRHLGMDCSAMGFVPLVDCKDNNYLMYNANEHCYEMVNIVDGMSFDTFLSMAIFWKSIR